MLKIVVFLLLLIISLSPSEILTYCRNTAAGFVGDNNYLYGQIMTPSVNKGTIQWVSVYTGYESYDYYGDRTHYISLWHFDGQQPHDEFFNAQVQVPWSHVGWYQTTVDEYWDGGAEQEFFVAFQSIATDGPYGFYIRSTIGFDGTACLPNRNMYLAGGSYWVPSPWSMLMFKVSFLPGGQGVVPSSLGVIKTSFH